MLSKKTINKFKQRSQKTSSVLMAILLFLQVAYPTQVMALTGGPSQPEVQSFEPVGTSDMVDLFTGDFSYNIPLLEVEGYPINIAYHSGVTTDQEASWVGLGWNINPGVINRNMRGIPDDFAGDNVVKEMSMKPNKTWGVALNGEIELFGKEKKKNLGGGLGLSYGFNFNNYTGPSISQSFNINLSAAMGGAGRLNGGLGLSSSSDEGLTVQPSIGFSKKLETASNTETNLGLHIGTSFNSRSGLKQLSISGSASMSYKGDYLRNGTKSDTRAALGGASDDKDFSRTSGSLGGSVGASASFDFGQPSYTPKIDMPMKNFSMSGKFTLGGEIKGLHGKLGLSGFYSAQELVSNTTSNPAYGYLYAEQGQHSMNAMLDFNREKDGTFTENTPSLPLTNQTFDTYGVSGQGIGGSYRPFRGDVGCVFDAESYTTNDNDALTVEVGIGGYMHYGTNINIIDVQGKSGKWKADNSALYKLVHLPKGNGNDFENVYFKEANEKTTDSDPSFYSSIGEDKAVRFESDFGKFDHKLKSGFEYGNSSTIPFSGAVKRAARDKKTQTISFLKRSEYDAFSIDPQSGLSSQAKPHHIAEIATLGTDGARYIYGIAAYNTKQKDYTFSVGSTAILTHDNEGSLLSTHNQGLVDYSASDKSVGNQKGIDNYYSMTETPAYAHSYLLTSVLGPDYIDADSIRGPSDADYGTYTKFKYKKVAGYKWRTPYDTLKASYTEGLKSDFQDDKGNIMYGEKDLWFLDSIVTKNYVAVFHKSNRNDGIEAGGENGGKGTNRLQKLDSISLYSKRNPSQPIKRVHFEYSYDLCQGVANSTSGGKLTLKKIYFSYQNSYRAKLSPYVFDYHEGVSAENPNYNLKTYDRWGNYKPNNATTIGTRITTGFDASSFIGAANIPPSDYPYTEQNPALEDVYSSAWTLKEIDLPSGGTIKINYESDDYAYVQNRQAGEMLKVVNYSTPSDASNSPVYFAGANDKFFFQLHNGDTLISNYVKDLKYIYFRFLVNIKNVSTKPRLEYVSGYAELDSYGFNSASNLGWIKLKGVTTNDNSGAGINPIVKAALNFGRVNMPKIVWDATAGNMSGTLSASILKALLNASYIKNIRDAIGGPNESLFSNYGVAQEFVAAKSWFRLNNPDGHKLGGGLRVKKIQMIDNWQVMAGSGNGETSDYGQEYNYDLEDGRSSGVASYEPQLGGDENCFKQPVFSNTKKLLVPDDESYMEEPFGESFFPSPSVGYSQVTVRNIARTNVTRHATGMVVNEFYTAKDFPTLTSKTGIKFRRGKDGPGSLRSLLKINTRDYFAATQGFAIELNDMHGKPKSQKVYQEGQATPITSVVYKYKCDPILNGSFKLNNSCTIINKDGTTSTKNIGMFFDLVGDLRESYNETRSITTEINVDVIPILAVPVPIPGIWPGYAKDKTRFRSATLTKVVQRFGILEETIATDLGSVVSTKNVAYDSETGGVLLTQTTTDYNDKLYNLKYPAWWYYENMGPASSNIDFEMNINLNPGPGGTNVNQLASLFKEGDELALTNNVTSIKGWISEINGTNIKVISKNGGSISGSYHLKIIRSGRKNNLTTDMATLTSLSNPIASLASNAYQEVLQASAVEYSNKRRTHCNCISQSNILPYSSNPYVMGTKGVWRQLRSFTHLTGRSQSNNNSNTNVRKDGVYESYTPFYKLTNGKWQTDPKDWTYASEVTEFNVFGQEVENKDPLNRYSSATFGYNQTMALSVAANSMYKEQGFDGFEDYRFNPCVDDHFKFIASDTISSKSHTGRYSYKIASGNPRTMLKQINLACIDSGDCKVNLTLAYDTVNAVYSITPSLGTAPYNYIWSISSGNPQIGLTNTGIDISGSNYYAIEVTVTDDKGCYKIIKVKK